MLDLSGWYSLYIHLEGADYDSSTIETDRMNPYYYKIDMPMSG